MAIKGAVRLDHVAATNTGKIINFKAATEFENGFVFTAEDLSGTEREVFTASIPVTADLATKSLYLNASVELTYGAGETIVDFSLPTGQVGRGVLLEQSDIVTITNNVIDGTPAKNKYLIPQNNSNKLIVANDLTGGTKFAAKIIDLEPIYGQSATVIRVLKN